MEKNIAIVFPGQGSQSIGMMSGFQYHQKLIREIFEEASDCLGYDMWELCQLDPHEKLSQTEFTQPALLTAGYAAWRVLSNILPNLKVNTMAGHSLGEYTALVSSEALAFSDGLKLVQQRARLMQSAVPIGTGAMAAILGLSEDILSEVCLKVNAYGLVEMANFNCPGQIVISGQIDAVQAACQTAKEMGAKRAMLLPVSVPSHSSLMEQAAAEFAYSVDDIPMQTPIYPIYSNVDFQPHNEVNEIKDLLVQQLYKPVHWQQIIESMVNQNTHCIIEAGPGTVLSNLSKRIHKPLTTFSINDDASMEKVIEHENFQ